MWCGQINWDSKALHPYKQVGSLQSYGSNKRSLAQIYVAVPFFLATTWLRTTNETLI